MTTHLHKVVFTKEIRTPYGVGKIFEVLANNTDSYSDELSSLYLERDKDGKVEWVCFGDDLKINANLIEQYYEDTYFNMLEPIMSSAMYEPYYAHSMDFTMEQTEERKEKRAKEEAEREERHIRASELTALIGKIQKPMPNPDVVMALQELVSISSFSFDKTKYNEGLQKVKALINIPTII